VPSFYCAAAREKDETITLFSTPTGVRPIRKMPDANTAPSAALLRQPVRILQAKLSFRTNKIVMAHISGAEAARRAYASICMA